MKITRLRLENLASLAGKHDIDFEKNPLASAGLIAITGKTGAGKSTLLDAMCLALYDGVPRLPDSENPHARRENKIIDSSGQSIAINDPRNLLRRGTTSGFSELEFIALNGKRYQARWEIWRAHKKVDGNIKVERSVTCLDDGRVMTQRSSDCTPFIERVTGLTFKQFTRAVLLAQSEVGAFLKAKDQERADLLEYLTNSHIFSLVSQKSAERHNLVKQQRTELEKDIGRIDILSAEELSNIESQQKALKLQLQNLAQSVQLFETEKKWYLERDQLYAEVHGKKEIYDVQLDAVHKSAEQQQLLQQLDDFQAIREQFVQLHRLQPLKHNTQQQQAAFQHSFEQLQDQLKSQKHLLDQQMESAQQFEQHRQAMKPHLELGLKLDHDIASISERYKHLNTEIEVFAENRIEPLKHQLAKQQALQFKHQEQRQQLHTTLEQSQFLAVYDQEPHSVLKNLQHYMQQYASLKTEYPDSLNTPVAELEQHITQLKQTLDQYQKQYISLAHLEQQITSSQKQQHQYQANLIQLGHQQQTLNQLISQTQEFTTLNTSIATEQKSLQDIEASINRLNTEIKTQSLAYTQLEEILAQQRLLHTENVQTLRAQLIANEPCLVCGSLEHPFVDGQQALEHNLLQLQEQQRQQAKDALSQLQNSLKAQEIEHSKKAIRIEQQQQRHLNLDQQIQQQRMTLTQALNQMRISIPDAQDLNAFDSLIQQNIEQLNTQIKHLGEQEQQQALELQKWRESQQQIQQLQLSLQSRTQLEQLIQPISSMLPDELQRQAPSLWVAQIQQQLQQRLQSLSTLKALENELQQIQQQIEQTQYQFDLEEKHYASLIQNREQLIEQGKQLRQQLAELTEHYAGQPYRVAAEWRNALEAQAQQHASALEQQRHQTTQAEQALHQANLKQQSFISQLKQLDDQLDEVQQQIQTWQLAHPSISPTQIEHWLSIDLQQHQRLRQDLSNQKQLLENAKTAWQVLEERYQAHLTRQPEHDLTHIEQQLTVLSQEKDTQQEALNELDAKLRINATNQSTYAQYQTQIEKIKAEEYRWGRIYDLIGHKDGTKFQKIAQEHHLDILVEYANQQLQPLAPRYQLHRIPNSLSLAIIDLDMNSEIRPVLSLSGGETFLVSLALALAIANMASGSMKLESLFIDEGFGTLDPASLHMVMNALDHLQSQGRKVVLISHVQEMHERIPVQIRVKSMGAGASSIEIVG